MILLLDNYDSFTYNLYQYLEELGADTKVVRNDKITLAEIEAMAPEKIVISPGPGRPENAGISIDVIKHFAGKIPLLGVCLGHQAIAEAFGGKTVHAPTLMHGKTSVIQMDGKGVFKDLPEECEVIRYHSLAVEDLPDCLEVSAHTKDGVVMAMRHKEMAIEGVQFHPESIMTEHGKAMLKNFLEAS